MHTSQGAAERARWEVMWVAKGRVVRKDCGPDLAEAIRVHGLAVAGGRKAVTLRCKNMSFPPPLKYADDSFEIVIRGRKRYKKNLGPQPPYTYRVKMDELNRKGVWWCSYCMKMRRFVKKTGYSIGATAVQDAHMACPMCGVSHRMVAKYNPIASRITARVQDPNRSRTRRRRRRTEED